MKTLVLLPLLLLSGCVTNVDEADSTDEAQVDPPVAVQPSNPPPRGQRTGFVLAHGLGGSVDSFDPAIVAAIQAEGYVDFVVPGVILICAGFGASSVAVSVNRDVTQGVMRRIRTLPIRPATVLAGHIVASMLRNLLATGIVIGVALAIGFRPTAVLADWLLVLAHVALGVLAITALFAFIGLVSSSPEAANGYGFALLFLPYVSSAFVPIVTMPAWMQPIATHQPINLLVESIRSLLVGQGEPRVPVSLAWCVGIIVVSAALVVWRFPRQH